MFKDEIDLLQNTIGSLKPLQNPHLWHISARCVSQTLAYPYDMSARFAILSL
ncbi:hypothetical protein [Wielerella bovis]|uniref:hypothetical protein n=1 Tax=Wielerella bovis TaxID=2917790 RepID=UPI002018911D|nr:hypothetical protein [Wielerella bovis]ULJ59449.1 hypothetical protein MIS44_06980 [Wielerella bovis]